MKKLANIPTEQTTDIASSAYQELVVELIERVKKGQLAAFRAVNKELIDLYWDLGRLIVERQKLHGWGKSVVEFLSKDLRKAFPRMNGFSTTNLWRVRAFYIVYKEYPSSEFLPPLVGEIGWTHNYIILEKCKDPNERLFYMHQTKNYGWTKNVLIHQIDNQSFEKTVISQQNFDQTLPEHLQDQAILAVKDDYTFGFLDLSEHYSEYKLEQTILNNIRHFLIEMGGDFCFIANQFPLDLNDKEYIVDLLLYHRGLQSLVAIDLKIGEFEPEHTGKMSFYLSKKSITSPSMRILWY